ncbi:MAG: methyltransferase domain-containing protein [Candidatus Contendobacter sp.]|nr:methyltransferase domain-containing protein [Candidatus Contendobacter sp.]MDG4558608.1 methyltransferase domain-containing protein [Candidatus Contendobacter sp.]
MSHVYRRPLAPDSQDSLAKLARLVRPASRVLDLGAGPGVLGRYLAERLGCTLDGVEGNPHAAAEAAPWYRRLECADLERIDLAERFTGCRYDFIVCADILEHLRQPGDLLAQLTSLLAPNGRVLASVPNIAYAGLIADLLAGEFRYRPEGLLDETHLRFFTLTSLSRLLEQHGLEVVAVDAALRDVRESEFTDRHWSALPPALTRALLGRPEALVYQFIVAAAVGSETLDSIPPIPTCPSPELRFACQLFWRLPGEPYREHASSAAWGRLGEARQRVALPLPPSPIPPEALRLDFADRPGLIRLYALGLHDNADRLLWEWDGRRDSLAMQPGQQLAFAEPVLSPGATVLLAGEDPSLELPIPAMALAELREGGELRLELSWPMSLDYLALVQDCIPRRDAEAMRADLARREEELKASVTALMERNVGLESALAARNAREVDLEKALAALTTREAELERQADALRALLNEQSAELAGLRAVLRRSWRERLWARLQRWRGRA